MLINSFEAQSLGSDEASSRATVSHAESAYHHFSTRGLAAVERIELWEHHNAQALVSLECRSLDDVPLNAAETNLLLPRLRFAHVDASPHIVERRHRHIAADNSDGVALYFSLAGEAFFYHHEGVHLQQPGTLLICDLNQPFLRGFAHGLQEYVLTIPRDIYLEVSGQALPKAPIVVPFSTVPGGNASAAVLARLMQTSLASPSVNSLAATELRALDLLHDLLASPAGDSASARRTTAIEWIRQNLRNPALSVATVAAGLGMSERALHRIFSDGEDGVARTILNLRLTLAHRVLTAPDAPTVGQVALYCGFVSAAHFSRVFKAHYGLTPNQAKRGESTVAQVQ